MIANTERLSAPAPDAAAPLCREAFEDFELFYAAGQASYDVKSPESGIRLVTTDNAEMHINPRGLRERWAQALVWGALGKTTDDYARELRVGYATARTHRKVLFDKLGATCMIEAVSLAFQKDIFQPTDMPARPLNLSDRQAEVLAALATGRTKQAVGKTLYVSPHTVKKHIQDIFASNHLNSTAHAVTLAYLAGQIPFATKPSA